MASLRRRRNSTPRRVVSFARAVGTGFLRAAPAIEANVARRSTLYDRFTRG